MNITRMRQEERLNRIASLQKSIEKAIVPDYERLELMACAQWGISHRTAKEYINIAKFNIENVEKEGL